MKKKAIAGMFFTICAFIFLLIPSEEISDSISQTVIFCGKTLIPQLFLYLCLSAIVSEMGIIQNIIFAFPKCGVEIAVFLMGILSGFPSGAIISGSLYENGIITKKRAEYLSTFSNNVSVSFVFGYISLYVGKTGALSIFICQILFSVVYALVGRKFLSDEDKKQHSPLIPQNPTFSSLVVALKKSTENIINICGFILFFSVFSAVILPVSLIILKGMIELTTGISMLNSYPHPTRLWCCALFSGFGGLCVHFQIFSACNVGVKKFFISKCISALLFPPVTMIIQKILTASILG